MVVAIVSVVVVCGEHGWMVETKVYTKEEYVTLIPPVSSADYERLKNSIREEGGLLIPITLNQDNVVIDGHHRLRACRELGLPVIYNIKDFTNRPLDELKFVVSVNLHRRHLDEFQRAEIGMKMEKIAKRIAAERKRVSQFTPASAVAAINRRFHGGESESDENGREDEDIRLASRDTDRIDYDSENGTGEEEEEEKGLVGGRTREQLAGYVGVSPATIDRARTNLEEGSQEQIASLRNRKSSEKGPGVRTVYEQVQFGKLQSRLQRPDSSAPAPAVRKDNLKLLNKDFRVVTQEEIPDRSVDLVLALNFPESRIREEW